MKNANKILIGTLIFVMVGFSAIPVRAQNANTAPEPSTIPSSSYPCGKKYGTSENGCSTCCKNYLTDTSGGLTTCEDQCKASFKQPDDKPVKTEKPEKKPSSNDEQFYKPLGGENFVCGGLMSASLRDELKKIYKTVSLIMVVAVVIFGMMDFFKAVTADNADAMKKATKTFTNRLIVVVLIATLPVLLDLLLSLFGNESMKNCIDYFGK